VTGWRTLLIYFTLAGVVESQAFGHLSAFRPLFLQQLQVPSAQIPFWTGTLASLGFVIGLPLLPFWGVWADRYNRKLIIARSAYVEGALFALAAFSPNVWFLAGAQLLSGFVFGNTGVMLAMLAEATPRKRLGMAVGVASAGFPIGSSVGPLLGGYVAQTFGIRPLLFGDGAASALIGLLLTLGVHERARDVVAGVSVRSMLGRAARDIVSSRLVAGIFGVYFLSVFSISLYTQLLPILIQRLDMQSARGLPALIGNTLAAAGVAMALSTPIWGRLGDTIGRWRTLPVILAALAVGIAALSLAPALATLQVSIVSIGLFQGGLSATAVALLALLAAPERRASILNFSLLPSQLSWFAGPLIGGALAGIALRIPFYAAAVVQLGALCLALLLASHARRVATDHVPAEPAKPGEQEPVSSPR
jgi:MFS family permease